jgi:ABC-type bacteriocin/lantibiotic exporter with double-glycine peptidase domain
MQKTALHRQALRLLSSEDRSKAIALTVLSIFLSLLEVATLTAVFPVLQGALNGKVSSSISNVIVSPTTTTGWTITLLFIVLLFILKNIAAVWLSHRQSAFANRLYLNFAERLYKHFYNQSWGEHTRENSAESFRKIKNTAYDFTNFVLLSYLNLASDLFTCIIMATVVIWFDYRIVFILVGLSIPLLISYYFFRRKIVSRIDKSFRELTPESNVILSQGIDCYAEAKIYNKENYFIGKFINISKMTTQQLARLKSFTAIPSRLLETVGIICFAGVIIYARAFNVTESNLTIFMGLLALALYRIVPSINRILISLSQIESYAYSIPELHDNLKGGNVAEKFSSSGLNFKEKIAIRNVSFNYAKLSGEILRSVNLEISKGDFIMLEGPSGAGKTTLIHLLAGLIQPSEGKIMVDGESLDFNHLHRWQKNLGFVPQASVILQATIIENIAFGEPGELIDRRQAEFVAGQAGIETFICSLPQGFDTPVGENGLTLSGGQRQRLILARALYRDPAVLLLDEVTNQLDEENRTFVLSTLRKLADTGKTILLATHDTTVKTYANRIARLEKGQLSESLSSING